MWLSRLQKQDSNVSSTHGYSLHLYQMTIFWVKLIAFSNEKIYVTKENEIFRMKAGKCEKWMLPAFSFFFPHYDFKRYIIQAS